MDHIEKKTEKALSKYFCCYEQNAQIIIETVEKWEVKLVCDKTPFCDNEDKRLISVHTKAVHSACFT